MPEGRARFKAYLLTAITAVVLMMFWFQASNWYQEQLLSNERNQVEAQIYPTGNALYMSINQRFSLLEGLNAFVLTKINNSDTNFGEDFNIFTSRLYSTYKGVDHFTVAPGGIASYVYPISGRETPLGNNQFQATDPSIRADVQRAVTTHQIILSDPHKMKNGAIGSTVRKAIYQGNKFWGLISIAIDMQLVLEEAGLNPGHQNLAIALRDNSGSVFFGEKALFNQMPIIYKIDLGDGSWELAGVPTGSWLASIQTPLRLFQGIGLITVFLLSMLVFLVSSRQYSLATQVKNRTSELEKELAARKATENALRESETKLSYIIDFLPDATFVIDRGGKVIAWNQAMESMTGLKSEDILGKGDYEYSISLAGQRGPILIDLVLKPDLEVGEKYGNIERSGNKLISEMYIPDLGGKETYLLGVASALYDSQGNIVGAIESIKDITERRHYEEILKVSLQEKEVLLQEVHHRVKNNLQIISSLLKLQSGYSQDERAKEALKESQDRIRSMALVHEKLYRSKDLAKINLTEYIQNLIAYLNKSYGFEKGIKINLDLEEAFIGIEKAVPFGLIITELFANSLKHAFPGIQDGEIFVGLQTKGDQLELVVKDNGVGLPEDLHIQKTGSLGLTLVYNLVKQLKGTIEANNNSGAEFKITFKT